MSRLEELAALPSIRNRVGVGLHVEMALADRDWLLAEVVRLTAENKRLRQEAHEAKTERKWADDACVALQLRVGKLEAALGEVVRLSPVLLWTNSSKWR